MSLHINRFVDNIKAHKSRGQKDFSMSMYNKNLDKSKRLEL